MSADQDTSAASNRRWYQFNLRTFFFAFTVLCLACGLDAYHGKWIRQRRDAFRREGIGGTSRNPHNLLAPKLAPRGMWFFGEPGYSAIFVRDDAITDERVEELREIFPEAKFVLLNRGRSDVLPPLD